MICETFYCFAKSVQLMKSVRDVKKRRLTEPVLTLVHRCAHMQPTTWPRSITTKNHTKRSAAARASRAEGVQKAQDDGLASKGRRTRPCGGRPPLSAAHARRAKQKVRAPRRTWGKEARTRAFRMGSMYVELGSCAQTDALLVIFGPRVEGAAWRAHACDKASAEEKVRDRVGRRCTPEGVMVKLALAMNWEKKTP